MVLTLLLSANVGDFVWIDGCPKTFEYWADGEPNNMDAEEDCGEVSLERHDQGKWNDIGCGYEFCYVCKYSTGNFSFRNSSFCELSSLLSN